MELAGVESSLGGSGTTEKAAKRVPGSGASLKRVRGSLTSRWSGWVGMWPQQVTAGWGVGGRDCPAGGETSDLELQVQTRTANSLAEIANHCLRKQV